MPEPIVFISHNRVKEGKLADYQQFFQEGVGPIKADKPGTVVFLAYTNEAGTQATIIHLFPDANAMAQHVQGAGGATADFTALGDKVNVAARLASRANAGEVLVSKVACLAAGIDTGRLEKRELEPKGRSEPVSVRVMHVGFGEQQRYLPGSGQTGDPGPPGGGRI